MDSKVGGTYRMSFTNFTTGKTHVFGGKYLDLVTDELIRYTDRFEDPNLLGEMITTVTLQPVSVGTEVNIVQEGLPAAIPIEACYLGWQQSLNHLAMLVEPRSRTEAKSDVMSVVEPICQASDCYSGREMTQSNSRSATTIVPAPIASAAPACVTRAGCISRSIITAGRSRPRLRSRVRNKLRALTHMAASGEGKAAARAGQATATARNPRAKRSASLLSATILSSSGLVLRRLSVK
jgi:hypothetical protein